MKTFYIHRLGCPKNDVDAEFIAGFLKRQNLDPAPTPEAADLLIVNSCAFIQPAKEESIQAALSLAKLKEKAGGKKLVITGCLSQRYAEELARDMPEVDGIFGLDDFTEMAGLIDGSATPVVSRRKNPVTYQDYEFPREVSAEETFAYIKISDGCDNRCSYCAIPDIRGDFRSRSIESVCREAEFLLDRGKKELILVSQESTAYGRDLYGKPRLIELLKAISGLSGEFWLRIMYLHPARLTEELIDYMIDNRLVCNYFDLPMQHINDKLLQAMGRKVTRRRIDRILDKIRAAGSRAAVRTNFIVGFPGETEAQFEELCRYIERQRFERLGAFVYSAEEGTAAAAMPNQVAEEVRESRYHRLMELQQQIAFENNDEETGRRYEVLIDEVDTEKGLALGRTRFDAPEIDQNVRLSGTDTAPGDFVWAKITGSDGYDLLGEREEV